MTECSRARLLRCVLLPSPAAPAPEVAVLRGVPGRLPLLLVQAESCALACPARRTAPSLSSVCWCR